MIRKISGYSLVEIIIVMVVLSILLAVGGSFLGHAKGGFASRDSIYSAAIVRTAFERMSRELKEARTASSADLSPGANTITFTTIDGNSITYSLSGTDLMRNTQILADHVTSLTFTYLTASNATTTDPTQVRCIVVDATANYQDITITLNTAVCPRNYNL